MDQTIGISHPSTGRAAELTAQSCDLQALMNTLPGGVFRCVYDERMTLLETNDGFRELFGYDAAQLHTTFANSYLALVAPEDREKVREQLEWQLFGGDTCELEYRILRADGSKIWVLDKSRLIPPSTPGEPGTLCCILVDITRSKCAQEELNLSLERHQLIMDQTNDIIFEWEIVTDRMLYSQNFEKIFGYRPALDGITTRIPLRENVHPEDLPIFLSHFDKCRAGIPYTEAEIRIRKADARYLWCRVRASTQLGRDGTPVKVVGVILDIDAERRNAQSLRDKAERDGLTGLYNKATARLLIENKLTACTDERVCALLVIDVDNFKQVNDTCGHLFGDAVLAAIANGMKKAYPKGTIGRIGGDEFILFLDDARDRKALEACADKLLRVVKGVLRGQQIDRTISCSIGVSIFPQAGKTFTRLFHNADVALYAAKKRGKDCICFYEPHMHDSDTLQPVPTSLRAAIDSEKESVGMGDKLVEYVFRVMYQSRNIHEAINLMLEIVGKQFEVSRMYIFENSGEQLMTNTFEWCNEGVVAEIENLQEVSLCALGDYYANFDEQGIFYCRDIRTLPAAQYELLDTQKIKALLQCAIWDEGKIYGFVGFDECNINCFWTQQQIDALSMIADILSIFLLKQRAQERAERAAERMRTMLDSQTAWVYAIEQSDHRILYANKQVFQRMPDLQLGSRCYEVFFHRDVPCAHCLVAQLDAGLTSATREMYNRSLDAWTLTDANRIDWDGRSAVLLTSRDITRYKKECE